MLTSILSSNQDNILTYKNSTNNDNSDSNISGDNDIVNEGYGAKIIPT